MEFLSLTIANVIQYLKSQLLLFVVSFFILAAGFYFLGLAWFALLALLVALIDFIPLIGSGIIFIPWLLYEGLWEQDLKMALAVLFIFIILEASQYLLQAIFLGQQLELPFWLTFLASLLSIVLASQLWSIILIPLVLPLIASIRQYIHIKKSKKLE